MQVVNIAEKFSRVSEHWLPKVIGELNQQQVKIARLLGEFDWHHHELEDELFLVISGELQMHVRDEGTEQVLTIREGEFLIVPRTVEHKPVAKDEVQLVLFEPATTRNTGNVTNDRTIEPERE